MRHSLLLSFVIAAVVCSVFGFGCGGNETGGAAPDAQGTPDAGFPADSGPAVDAAPGGGDAGPIDTGAADDAGDGADAGLTTFSKELLGQIIFFDPNLSTPPGQSCASCHAPESGFADPRRDLPVSRGAVEGRAGSRNALSAAYASHTPEFHFDKSRGGYFGGLFWDGRAKNLVEQAKQPFLNSLEMNNADAAEVVGKVKNSEYAAEFDEVFGPGSLDDVDLAYGRIAEAVAAFEATPTLNRFSSKFDAYLAGKATLSPQEERGLKLFTDPAAGNCAQCHPADPGADGTPPMFTTFGYENTALPKNPDNPFYSMPPEFNPAGTDYTDLGLGGHLGDPAQNGKMKIPSLRNIDLTGPYMHQGFFASLEHVMVHYCKHGRGAMSGDGGMCPCGEHGGMDGGTMMDGGHGGMDGGMTMDAGTMMDGGMMADAGSMMDGGHGNPCMVKPPEVPETVADEKLASITTTPADYEDLIAFLKTLSDGYMP